MVPILILANGWQGAAAPSDPLERMSAAFRGHRAVECHLINTMGQFKSTSRLRILSPSCLSYMSDKGGMMTDGNTAWFIDGERKTWHTVKPSVALWGPRETPGFGILLGGHPTRAIGPARRVRFDGQPALAIPIAPPPAGSKGVRVTLFLNPKTYLPLGVGAEFPKGSTDTPVTFQRFRNIKFDPPLTPADFRFTPPAGYRRG